MDIREVEGRALDATTKGLPGPVTPATVAARRWSLLDEDLPLPVMVLRESALAGNLAAMARWCERNGFLLAPHAKTTMCPQIWKRQLDLGAWGLTVATATQATVCARFGVRRILVANQLVGRANVRAVVSAMSSDPALDLYGLLDSVEGADHLAVHAREAGAARPIRVLVEFGRRGWRTGARTLEEVREVLSAAQRHVGTLEPAGIEGYEGLARPDEGPEIEAYLADLGRAAEALAREVDAPPAGFLLSVGGSAYLDYVRDFLLPLRGKFRLVLRSGCTATSDHGTYARHLRRARDRGKGEDGYPEFRPALELWSVVQSVRDGDTAILAFGRRDCPYDGDLPLPLFSIPPGGRRADARPLSGAKVVKLNDQHAFMALPPGLSLKVGDRVACGISHPCTAFDKWAVLPLVDDDYRVLDLYCTYF